MLQRQREIDNNFSGLHLLYRRFTNDELLGNRLNPAKIAYKNTSVNWSKYSKPWDVIFDYPDYGYCQLMVKHLPTELPKEIQIGSNAKLHSFMAEHKPLQDNYSHSEIVTYKENVKVIGNVDLPNTVKKEFRTIISDKTLILSNPKL
jgi:hypothetical protein